MNAMIIDEKDNVAVVIDSIQKGTAVIFKAAGEIKEVQAKEDITIYHKMAIRSIRKGEAIVKYGEHIGIAACDIEAGEHVHVHNVESHREDL